jgi:hypothetical protein
MTTDSNTNAARDTVCWFIERGTGEWWTGNSGWTHWSRDPLKAVRFCRREDADAVILGRDIESTMWRDCDPFASEHIFLADASQSPASAPEQAQPRTQAEACQQPWVLTPEGARNMEEMTQAAPEQASVAAGAYTARIKHALEFYAGEKFSGLARDALEALAALSPRPSDVREQQAEQIAKLQRFKDWVHAYLDAQGVPHHPPGTHGAEGCRIGDRMDWLMDRLRKAEAQQAEQGDGGLSEAIQLLEQNGRKDLAKMVRDALATLAAAAKGQGTVTT